jgi:prevent-host-death family protein
MEKIVGITEFRDQAKALIDRLGDRDVIVVRHSKPVAVLVHPDRLERLYERIEDLEDQLALHNLTGELIPHDVAMKELSAQAEA